MTENTFLVPAQTRTIFVNTKYYDQDVFGTIKKYRLNLPEFLVKRRVVDGKTRWKITAVCEGKIYWPPLLNVNEVGNICLGQQITNNKDFVNSLFCTYFNLDCVGSIRHYVNLPDCRDEKYVDICCERIDKFYRDYEKNGTIKFI
jgi:hypothetical protein